MKMRNKLSLFSLLLMITACRSSIDSDKVICHPEQVHLSFGDTVSEMVVMWSTPGQCSADVHYGAGPWDSSNSVKGTTIAMVYQNPNITSFLHRAKLTNLNEDTTYYYMPMSNDVSSGPFYFKTPIASQDWQAEFLVYGDLGVHSESLPNVQLEALKGKYAAVLHVGDFGYNLFDTINDGMYKGQNVGDVFMRQIEEIASHVPYMVSPGNHEIESETFNQYRYRFSMPNSDWPIPLHKMWYSFDIGPIHFLSYSTEVFFVANGQYIESQRQWIMADLEAANNNRHSRPWIVAFGHRPMYCSNNDDDDCTMLESKVRLGLEDLFYRQGVDVVIQAHEHSYERLWPMYKGVVLSYNYTNPRGPVQLISGAAGSKHGVDEMNPKLNETWSAFRMANKSFNSYGRLKAYNSTHLFWDQVAVLTGEVLDSIWIVQESHGPFTQTSLQEEQKIKINEQKEKDDVIINSRPKPKTTGDTLTQKVSKAIKGADIKLIVGVSFGVFVLLFLVMVCIIRRCCCKRRSKSYRRWETLDYGKKFYTNLKNEEKEADDFEVEVTDGTTKLIDNAKD